MVTLAKPSSASLVADAYKQLQDIERACAQAYQALTAATEPEVSMLEYGRAVDAYRQAYLAECEVSGELARRAAILEGCDADIAERVGACYTMTAGPRMEPTLFVQLHNYLRGYCAEHPVPDDFIGEGYAGEAVAALPCIDEAYRTVDADVLQRSAESIVLDLDVWGIPLDPQPRGGHGEPDDDKDYSNYRRWDGYPEDYDPAGDDLPF